MTRWPLQRWGGITALAGVVLFAVVVVTLHLVQPAYQPRDQLMSELALGEHGWAMFVAFLGLAMGVLGIQAGVTAFDGPLGYRLLLGLTATFFLVAGVFPLDESSFIHISSIGTAFILVVLAIYLFPTSAGRASVAGPRRVSWPLAVGIATSVALGHSVMPMGFGQRLAATCLLLWLGVVGWKLLRL